MKLVDTTYFSLAKSYLTSLVKKKEKTSSSLPVSSAHSCDSNISASADQGSMKRSTTEEGLKNINSLLMSLVGRNFYILFGYFSGKERNCLFIFFFKFR